MIATAELFRDVQVSRDLIYVPSTGLYVSREITLFNENWNESHKVLQSSKMRMQTIPEFIEFLKHCKVHRSDVYQEVTRLNQYPGKSRGEWLDAYFFSRENETRGHIFTGNKTWQGMLDNNTLGNSTFGSKYKRVPLNLWLANPTKLGLPQHGQDIGGEITSRDEPNLEYYPPWDFRETNIPRYDSVAVFSSGDRLILSCAVEPHAEYSMVGVRPAFKK